MASYTMTPDYADQTVTLKVTGGAKGAQLQIIIREAADSTAYIVNTIEKMTSSTWSETYSGFSTCEFYVVNIRYNSGSWLGSKQLVFPEFSLSDITETGLQFNIDGVDDESAHSVRYYIRTPDSSSVLLNEDYTENYESTSFYRWFKNILSPGTDYVANVRIDGHWLEPQTFKTKGSSRPYNWNWYSDIAQGKPIKLSAREWNDFCTKINAFRKYKGLSSYDFTTVSRGQPIKSSVVNEALTAISAIPGHGGLPNRTYSGQAITAYYFLQLRIALNKVP